MATTKRKTRKLEPVADDELNATQRSAVQNMTRMLREQDVMDRVAGLAKQMRSLLVQEGLEDVAATLVPQGRFELRLRNILIADWIDNREVEKRLVLRAAVDAKVVGRDSNMLKKFNERTNDGRQQLAGEHRDAARGIAEQLWRGLEKLRAVDQESERLKKDGAAKLLREWDAARRRGEKKSPVSGSG